jgi:hypothetical protein
MNDQIEKHWDTIINDQYDEFCRYVLNFAIKNEMKIGELMSLIMTMQIDLAMSRNMPFEIFRGKCLLSLENIKEDWNVLIKDEEQFKVELRDE